MTTTISTYPNRDIRQRQIIPPEELAKCHALVIGVGAIGRQVALQLAGIGVASMELVDHDTVGEENLAAQGYWPVDMGQPKVQATAELCRAINPETGVTTTADRFKRSQAKALGRRTAVFCCVDSITTRGLIWEAVKSQVGLFVDGRMNAEVIRVLSADRPASDWHYAKTLFPERDAYAGSCTARSTFYTASIAAGLMVSQFTRWLRELPVEKDFLFNVLCMDLTVH